MKGYSCLIGALAMVSLASAAPAAAGTVVFSGTRQNVNLLNPPGTGRCAPLNTVNIAPGALSSTGSSNLGSFASTQSHCIPGAPSAMTPVQPITDGIFTYDFGSGHSFSGIYTGMAVFDPMTSQVTGTENFVIQSGTGRFLGASGFLQTVGNLMFAPNPQGPGFVGIYSGVVNGEVTAPGIPEPGTWALLILGFGAVGAGLRTRARRPALAC